MAVHAPAQDSVQPQKVSLTERVRTWLSHPFFLLLMGALITGIFVPEFTHHWQAAEMAQSTKTKVIADVSDAASTAMTQLEIDMNPVLNSGIATSTRLSTPRAIAGSYDAWTMKSTSVASEIAAYFPDNGIPRHWADLSGLIKNFFLLTYATDGSMRRQYIASLKGYFDFHHIATGVDWSALQPDTPSKGATARPCRAARPERGTTRPACPSGIATAIPVPTTARSPGSSVTRSQETRSRPASPG